MAPELHPSADQVARALVAAAELRDFPPVFVFDNARAGAQTVRALAGLGLLKVDPDLSRRVVIDVLQLSGSALNPSTRLRSIPAEQVEQLAARLAWRGEPPGGVTGAGAQVEAEPAPLRPAPADQDTPALAVEVVRPAIVPEIARPRPAPAPGRLFETATPPEKPRPRVVSPPAVVERSRSLPDAAPVPALSAARGSRTAGRPAARRVDLREQEIGRNPADICAGGWERARVRELRGKGVPWSHIARQLDKREADLKALYGDVVSAPSPRPAVAMPARTAAPTAPPVTTVVSTIVAGPIPTKLPNAQRVLLAFAAGATTAPDIARLLKRDVKAVIPALAKFRDRGLAVSEGRGLRGAPLVWRLTPAGAAARDDAAANAEAAA